MKYNIQILINARLGSLIIIEKKQHKNYKIQRRIHVGECRYLISKRKYNNLILDMHQKFSLLNLTIKTNLSKKTKEEKIRAFQFKQKGRRISSITIFNVTITVLSHHYI